jgi:hypothetical protein
MLELSLIITLIGLLLALLALVGLLWAGKKPEPGERVMGVVTPQRTTPC